MADNWRSRTITQGDAGSPTRVMLRAVGLGDGDCEKAIVGVANGHSTMNPCNAGIQPLVDRAAAAVKAAGAMPQVFGFPTVTDGIGMGTEGMKYSLVSREVIADAIETAVNGQMRSEERRVGKEGRSRWAPYHLKKKKKNVAKNISYYEIDRVGHLITIVAVLVPTRSKRLKKTHKTWRISDPRTRLYAQKEAWSFEL